MFSRIETYIAELQADPVAFLITMAYTWGVILFSLILHECAHGYVAYRCGDPTAKMMGRLSLNPLHHLDPIGTLMMFAFGFGWAKPVPVNPRNFRHYRRDDLLVSLAGITVNFTIFLLAVLLSCMVNRVMMGTALIAEMQELYDVGVEPFVSPFYNVGNALMDGDWEMLAKYFPMQIGTGFGNRLELLEGMDALRSALDTPWLLYVQRGLLLLALSNLSLALFNLLPVPPLDGFRVVNDVLLRGKLYMTRGVYRVAWLAMAVLMYTDAFDSVLSFCISHVYQPVLSLCLMLTGQM